MKLLLSLLLSLCVPNLYCAEKGEPEVFFSVSRAQAARRAVPADAAVLRAAELEQPGAAALADLLEPLPALGIRRQNGALGLATAGLRGYQSKQTAVYLDDIRLPADITGTVDLSVLPAEALGRVEVLPGAASSLYGQGAEGGVLHLFTRKLSPGARLASAGISAASHDTSAYSLKTGAAGPAGDFFAAGSALSAGGFQRNSKTERESALGRASADLGTAGRLGVTGLYSRLKTGLPSGTPAPVSAWDGSAERAPNSLTDWQRSRRGLGALSWSGGADSAAFRAESSISSNDIEAFQYGSLSRSRIEDLAFSGRLTVLRRLVLGAETSRSSLYSGLYGDRRLHSAGFFAQHAFSPAAGLELSPSARLDRHSAYDSRVSPRLGAVYAPDASWKFSASVGRGYQAPTFADLYNPWAAPAPGLKPETSLNTQAAASYGSPDGWRVSLAGYYSDIKDRIALDPLTWAAANLDAGFNYGLETGAGWEGGGFSLAALYARNVSKARSGGGRYELMNFSPAHRVSGKAAYKGEAWRAWLDGRGVSQQYAGRGAAGNRLPEFWLFGLGAALDFGGLEFWGSITNLLDRHYAETADAFNGWYPQPGRTFSAGLNWRLL